MAIRPWLYRIAHNQCVTMLRRRPAHPTQPLTGFEVLPAQGMAERVETAEELSRLRQDLLALPHDQRGALVLRELSGLSHSRIAEVLNESAASVKQLIYQARTGLYAMAEGRTLHCDTVRRRISDGNGRVLAPGAWAPTCAPVRRAVASARPLWRVPNPWRHSAQPCRSWWRSASPRPCAPSPRPGRRVEGPARWSLGPARVAGSPGSSRDWAAASR